MKTIGRLSHLILIIGVSIFAATPGVGTAQESTPKKAAAKKPAGKKPRVFFIEPRNGATVTSPVHLRFGVENYEIAPVPQGTVQSARKGMGHHHVGVDTKC